MLLSLPLVGRVASESFREPGGVTHEDPTLLLAHARSFPPRKGEGEEESTRGEVRRRRCLKCESEPRADQPFGWITPSKRSEV